MSEKAHEDADRGRTLSLEAKDAINRYLLRYVFCSSVVSFAVCYFINNIAKQEASLAALDKVQSRIVQIATDTGELQGKLTGFQKDLSAQISSLESSKEGLKLLSGFAPSKDLAVAIRSATDNSGMSPAWATAPEYGDFRRRLLHERITKVTLMVQGTPGEARDGEKPNSDQVVEANGRDTPIGSKLDGHHIIACWWTPYSFCNNIENYHDIILEKKGNESVTLTARSAKPFDKTGRLMRIEVHVLYVD